MRLGQNFHEPRGYVPHTDCPPLSLLHQAMAVLDAVAGTPPPRISSRCYDIQRFDLMSKHGGRIGPAARALLIPMAETWRDYAVTALARLGWPDTVIAASLRCISVTAQTAGIDSTALQRPRWPT